MPTAKKLPSGNYRVLVYSHKENGKRIYKSFTASTKKEAELQAAEWKNGKRNKSALKVSEAIQGYIRAKAPVLSPSTVRGYYGIAKRYFSYINDERLDDLTTEKVQLFISDLSKKVSPKTVRNVHGFFMSVIGFYLPDKTFKITLPPMYKAITSAPSDEDIKALYGRANHKLKICIALAAFGSLRRGEICALKFKDITGDTVSIHADMVKDVNSKWIYKEMPKTTDSIRNVSLPKEVIELIGNGEKDDFIVKWTPDSVTKRFIDLKKEIGIDIRFHDLRHYFASIGAVLQIPQPFLKSFGGWSANSKIISSVYQNKIVPLSEHYSGVMIEHFENILNDNTKCNTEKKKAR